MYHYTPIVSVCTFAARRARQHCTGVFEHVLQGIRQVAMVVKEVNSDVLFSLGIKVCNLGMAFFPGFQIPYKQSLGF